MIAMNPYDTGAPQPVDGAANPANFAGSYAVEGHADNSASVPASPPPPVIVPATTGAQVVQNFLPLAPTPIAPVIASLVNAGNADTSTPGVQGLISVTGPGQPAAGGGTTGGLVQEPSIFTPASEVSSGGAGMPGPVIPTPSDVGVGGADFGAPLAIQPSARSSANGSTAQSLTVPQLSPLAWLAIGLAALHLFG